MLLFWEWGAINIWGAINEKDPKKRLCYGKKLINKYYGEQNEFSGFFSSDIYIWDFVRGNYIS